MAHTEDQGHEPLMTTKDLAEFLAISVRTIEHWRLHGDGPPAYRVGRHLRYRASDVEAWLTRQRAA